MILSNQEVFDAVVKHARTQKKKSFGYNKYGLDRCAYRGKDDTKCFAGIFISDDEYCCSMEGASVITHCEVFGKKVDDLWHLKSLQEIHDLTEVSDWEKEFKRHALCFDLKYTPPEVNNDTTDTCV